MSIKSAQAIVMVGCAILLAVALYGWRSVPPPPLEAEPVSIEPASIDAVLRSPTYQAVFNRDAGSASETNAVLLLNEYVPNPTHEQVMAVQKWVYHMKVHRAEWQAEFDAMREEMKNARELENADDFVRHLNYRWKASEATLSDVATRLNATNREYMATKMGLPESLLDKLWNEANPTGRMPWEE